MPPTAPALRAAKIEAVLDLGVPLQEKTLRATLYETAARSSEVLALDVRDLDRCNRRSEVTCQGSAVDVIVRQTWTARLLDGRGRGQCSSLAGGRASPCPPPT